MPTGTRVNRHPIHDSLAHSRSMSIVGFRSTLPVPIGDMAGDERPAKRMKLGGQDAAETGAFTRGNLPSSASFNVLSNAAAASQTWEVPGMVDDAWKYAGAGPAAPPSGFFMPMMPVNGVYPMFQDSQVELIPGPPLFQPEQGGLPIDNYPTTSQPRPPSRVIPPARRTVASTAEAPSQDHRRRKSRSKTSLISPFRDCIDTFGKIAGPRYQRPTDGKVNGYIKFNWPQGGGPPKSTHRVVEITDENPGDDRKETHGVLNYNRQSSASSEASSASSSGCPAVSSTALTSVPLKNRSFSATSSVQETDLNLTISPVGMYGSTYLPSPPSSWQTMGVYTGVTESPQLVPPHFGEGVARMDDIDRKFWGFYVQNWCPGRSVLKNTNLWLTDFAKMKSKESILSAIQSLAGIYIYDYQPAEVVRNRVNKHFTEAESRLSHLLENAAHIDNQEATELITLSSILSMQDIVLTERRLKRPYNPRWLQGFKQGEHFLQATDPGNRFWKTANVQLDSLRISQAVIVGRAVILAQPMMPLPPPATFDAQAEAARFGWLLYGTRKEMHEIHGGCGFSKRLLHIFSQITYCAARLNQDRESPVVPKTAEHLHAMLLDLRQWSGESTVWEEAKMKPQPVSWIRSLPDGYVIGTSEEMTDVTAEAWRMAGLLYLQCRLLRLPRNDPAVLCNLGDLAKCISIMPTSGYVFTAQAPLLPVFFLGLLATLPEHKAVALAWFEQVICIPVRSSVPPLYDALKRILSWLPNEIELPLSTNMELAPTIAERQPWWERMVSKVQEKEPEVLCLT